MEGNKVSKAYKPFRSPLRSPLPASQFLSTFSMKKLAKIIASDYENSIHRELDLGENLLGKRIKNRRKQQDQHDDRMANSNAHKLSFFICYYFNRGNDDT